MSALEGRPLDKLVDMILNVLWRDPLEVWVAIRRRLDTDGAKGMKAAFDSGSIRFLNGPFKDHIEVRWGMSQCVHCNDTNIEKNGIACVMPNGDGLEFNQCLNCRIGILYNVVSAKAIMDSYLVSVGKPGQFNGVSFYWDAIVPAAMRKFQPLYEIVKDGRWTGSVAFDQALKARFLPCGSMTSSTAREAEASWKTTLPSDVAGGVDAFVKSVRPQIEVVLAIR